MHVRLISDELETATEDGSEGPALGSWVPYSGSKVPYPHHTRPARSSLRQEEDAATPANGPGQQQRLALFASSIKIQPRTSPLSSAAPGPVRPRASRTLRACGPCPRAARSRERASSSAALLHPKFSCSKVVSSDTRSRRRLNRCVAGFALGSTSTIDARRRREEESARVVLSSCASLLVGDEERMLSKRKGSSLSLPR